MPGRIISISRDAIRHQKLGAYYLARIALLRSSVATEGGVIPLSPGLTATADIGIGRRRIIEYIVSPLNAAAQEAGHEQ